MWYMCNTGKTATVRMLVHSVLEKSYTELQNMTFLAVGYLSIELNWRIRPKFITVEIKMTGHISHTNYGKYD